MAARRTPKLRDHMVLGLDIGTRFIKVVEVRLMRGAIAITNVAMRPTPPGVLSNSQILDPVGLGRAIRELLVLNRFSTRKVIVAITGQSSVVVRPIELPKMTRKELAQTMKFEVERHIPFAADEVVMDYSPVIEPEDLPEEEGQMKVLLAVAQEELINAYLKTLSVAGLQPYAMDVEILAAVRSLVDVAGEEGAYDETVALVDLGACSTDISIIKQGNLAFTRSVPIAGDSLTEAIAEQLGRSFDEAEELKKQHGRVFIEEAFTLGGETPPPTSLEVEPTVVLEPEPEAPAAPAADAPDQITSFFSAFDTPAAAPAPAPAPEPAPTAGAFSLDEFDTPGPTTVGAPTSAPTPSPVFQLDDDDVDDDVPGPLTLTGPAAAPAAPLMRLSLDDDDDVDDEPGPLQLPTTPAAAPVFALDDDAPSASPVFALDDDVNDEPVFLIGGQAVTRPAAEVPGAPDDEADDDLAVPMFSLDPEPTPEPPASSFSLDPEPEPPAPAGLDLDAAPVDVPAPASAPAPAADPGPVFDLSSELESQLPTTYARPAAQPAEEEEELFSIMPPAPAPAPAPAPEPAPVVNLEPAPAEPPAPLAFDTGFEVDAPGPIELTPPLDPPAPVLDLSAPAPEAPFAPPAPGASLDAGVGLFEDFGAAPALLEADEPAEDGGQGDVFQRRIFESMLSTLMEMVTEIRRSLEYYSGREPDHPITRIVLYGGTSRLPNIAPFLSGELGIDVVVADPLQAIEVASTTLPEAYVQEVAAALPVSLGLGMRDMLA